MAQQDKTRVVVEGRELTLTNLRKVLYPEDGFTKAEVLDYYQRISSVLLPHVAGRPMTLKRYPEGVDGESFFQKHAPEHRPSWVRTERVESQSSRGRGETIEYVVMDDLPTLIWAANLAALELHVPQWRFPPTAFPRPTHPDRPPGPTGRSRQPSAHDAWQPPLILSKKSQYSRSLPARTCSEGPAVSASPTASAHCLLKNSGAVMAHPPARTGCTWRSSSSRSGERPIPTSFSLRRNCWKNSTRTSASVQPSGS